MLIRTTLVLEILSVIICIHCVYGKKVTLDIQTIILFLSLLLILELINNFQINGLSSVSIYVLILAYCKSKFKQSFLKTVISVLIFIIVLTILQFVCMVFVNGIIVDNEVLRTTVGNAVVLCICLWLMPKVGLDKLRDGIYRKCGTLILVFGSMVVLIMLLQDKIFAGINIDFYVLTAPAMLMLLFWFGKWSIAQRKVEDMQQEIEISKNMQKQSEELLIKIRMRQHEFKNHLSAIFSTHYTYKTYEKLVKAQEEYCNELQNENKYNNLLVMGDSVLIGFLYGKFQQIEADGIQIDYKINTRIEKYAIPTYHLVEILGVLFDNAVEAIKESLVKEKIYFSVLTDETVYRFVVRNRFQYTPYSELEEWFRLESSNKGYGRGLGLYHVKQLCDELGCSIVCRNTEIDNKNWIEFTLIINKASRD